MNILGHLEIDYRGQMTDRQMFEDSRFETNIIGITSVPKFLAGHNIQPVGGTKGDTITNTCEFVKGCRHTHDQTSNSRSYGRQPRTHNIPRHLRHQLPTYFRNSVQITPAQNVHNIGDVKQRVHRAHTHYPHSHTAQTVKDNVVKRR